MSASALAVRMTTLAMLSAALSTLMGLMIWLSRVVVLRPVIVLAIEGSVAVRRSFGVVSVSVVSAGVSGASILISKASRGHRSVAAKISRLPGGGILRTAMILRGELRAVGAGSVLVLSLF